MREAVALWRSVPGVKQLRTNRPVQSAATLIPTRISSLACTESEAALHNTYMCRASTDALRLFLHTISWTFNIITRDVTAARDDMPLQEYVYKFNYDNDGGVTVNVSTNGKAMDRHRGNKKKQVCQPSSHHRTVRYSAESTSQA